MRLDELSLVNYGAFASRVLDLRRAPGLAIVYGPNEAGKSTCLAAALDFLFGIPHTSPHGGVFGYDKMRLDGSVRNADGQVWHLRRRKGKSGKTLLSADGTALDDQVLAQAFGAFTRERYRALFALDHTLLRSGGEALLRSSGEIGRLIVEAGGGLSQLMPLMAELDSEAEALYAPRAAKERAFYKALGSLQAADKGIREGTLTREAYELAEATVAGLVARIAELRAEQKALRARAAQAERLVRVSPLVLELAQIEAAIAREGSDPVPGEAWLVQVKSALLAHREADAGVSAAEAALKSAVEGVAAVAVDSALLAQAPLLTALEERRKRFEVLRERETSLRDDRARVRALLAQAAHGPLSERSAEAGRTLRRELEALQPRALRVGKLREQERAAILRQSEDEAEALAAHTKRAERSARGVDRPWPLDLGALGELAPALEQAARSALRFDADQQRLADALTALGFSHADRLRELVLPDVAVVRDAVEAERRAAESARQRELSRVDAQRRADIATARLRELESHGTVPRPETLASVRGERDGVWAEIRAEFVRGGTAEDPLLQRAARDEDSARFEALIRESDGVADVLTSAAQHVAEARVLEREVRAAHRERDLLIEAENAEQTRLSARRAAISTAFPALPSTLASPLPLLALIERRTQLLAEDDDLRRRRDEADALAARTTPLLRLLEHGERMLALEASDAPTAVRVAAVLGGARAHDAAFAEHLRSEQEEATRAPARAERGAQAALLKREREQEEHAFRDTLRSLGLPAETSPDHVAGLVKQLRDRETAEADGERLDADLADIARAEAELGEARAKLDALGVSVAADVSPSAAALVLQRRFAEALAAAERRRTREEVRTLAAAGLHSAQLAAQRAAAELQRLAAVQGIDVGALSHTSARAERLLALEATRETALLRIGQAGDGHAVTALAAELAERDITLVRAEIPAFASALKVLEDTCDNTLVALVHAEAELRRFSSEGSLNQLHAAREAASAELSAAVERYLELRFARELLGRAVERVRNQQRDPLVTRASALFALATEGAFARIDTEISRDGEPVVLGVRNDGGHVALHEMSDGTRDQLFLSFRLASVEHYCQVREPLPFIGDDLLVHFDDARSRATLRLLAELAKTTQVLLFTHHRSVCDAAQPLIAEGLAHEVSLGTRVS